jgi:hypothetical protein
MGCFKRCQPGLPRVFMTTYSLICILYMIDSGFVGSLGGVPREQEMLKGHLSRFIYHQLY